jgi:hypothetical protein
MTRYRVLTLVLLGRVEVFPTEYLIDPSFIRRGGGIAHCLSSETWSRGRVVLSHAPLDV